MFKTSRALSVAYLIRLVDTRVAVFVTVRVLPDKVIVAELVIVEPLETEVKVDVIVTGGAVVTEV